MRRVVAGIGGAALALSGLFALPAQAHEGHAAQDAFTTKTAYEPQGSLNSYERLPSSFRPVFTENVSRHGARTLSDSDDGDALLALWNSAKAEGALTSTGRQLGPDVQSLLAANARDGYGLLTQEGRDEMRTTAQRMVRRLPSLFADAAKGGAAKIDVVASSQQRTVDSANEFVAGLKAAKPGLATTATRTDDALLYFHKSNVEYNDYVDNDPRVAAAEKAATDQPRTHAVARSVLQRSFSKKFVDEIAAGKHAEFKDEVAAADALYSMDQVTADLAGEGRWHFDRYLTTDEAAWFGYLDDVTSFYENGPAFAGSDITYKMAGGLLSDMFAQLDAKRVGTTTRDAELRFTHAEEIFPLASLLGLPGSTQQQPENKLFTYANNPFRGAQVAPMAANIQWDLYTDGHTYLVRMLYNEKQTPFKASCAPVHRGSSFYRLDELERCYAQS
ncbi:histidine-type phosphatase [Amycolatopsis rhabdoformis]|uniref:Multiple inositol polyphosphate phosphatase 1 n=1 Tax=Amycolatopsis rhabdoformis TaxID=1448059 RepID=A0ABZ1I9S4_9PSEU|nr:histidine-type phosphatase [Amycolatopsis rhabdoformis]WSE31230.1 histidine-type phosphatase [Amycolatopsis rhabdoformis]